MAAPEFLNITTQSDSGSFNVTANAGVNRCLVVWTWEYDDEVTAVAWGGDALTLIESETYGLADQRVWIRAIGNAESNETKTLTVTVTTDLNNLRVLAMVYQYVNQTTPNQSQSLNSSESTSTTTFTGANMTYTGADALVVAYAQAVAGTVSITNSGFTQRGATTYIKVGDYTDTTSPAAVSVSNTVSVENLTAGGVVLAGQKDNTFTATPLILAATIPNQTVSANTTVTPLVLTSTLPNQTASVETSKWTNKDKSTAPSWVNKDKS